MRLDRELFRYRYALSGICLFWLLYCSLYSWLIIPYHPYVFSWRPDHQIRIEIVTPESPAYGLLQDDDKVLAINDIPAYRTNAYFPLPSAKASYTLTIERQGEILQVDTPFQGQPDTYGLGLRAPAAILSFLFWLSGSITLYYSWKENSDALRVGGIFLLASFVIMSWNSTLLGVPATGVFAQPLMPLLAVGWLYLGLLPTRQNQGHTASPVLRFVIAVAIVLGCLSLYEEILLFPVGESIESRYGVSLYLFSGFLQALGVVGNFVLVLVRWLKPGSVWQRRQTGLLLFITVFGTLPPIGLMILSVSDAGQTPLATPIAIIYLLMVPLGYMYIVFRNGFLNLDTPFSQITALMLLAAIVTFLYVLIQTALTRLMQPSQSYDVVLVFVFMLVLPYLLPRVTAWTQRLFFGDFEIGESVTDYIQQLNQAPELATIDQILANVCERLAVPSAALIWGRETLSVLSTVGEVDTKPTFDVSSAEKEMLFRPNLQRHMLTNPLTTCFSWSQLALPLIGKDEAGGFILLARPTDGYFDAIRIRYLKQVGRALANGVELMQLQEISFELSQRIHSVALEQRYEIGRTLHNQPLQKLFPLHSQVQSLIESEEISNEVVASLQRVATQLRVLDDELREVHNNIYPVVVDFGVLATIDDLAVNFQIESGLRVDLILEKDANPELLENNLQLAKTVYTIAREALNNVIKHAQADSVVLEVSWNAQIFLLKVTDDGIHNPALSMGRSDLLQRRHFGIVSMITCAKAENGQLKIYSENSRGTTILLMLPLEP